MADGRRDKRIFSTGCAGVWYFCYGMRWLTKVAEQLKMNDCYFDKKDWRSCKKEVSEDWWFVLISNHFSNQGTGDSTIQSSN